MDLAPSGKRPAIHHCVDRARRPLSRLDENEVVDLPVQRRQRTPGQTAREITDQRDVRLERLTLQRELVTQETDSQAIESTSAASSDASAPQGTVEPTAGPTPPSGAPTSSPDPPTTAADEVTANGGARPEAPRRDSAAPSVRVGCVRGGYTPAEVRAAMGEPDSIAGGWWIYGRTQIQFGYGTVQDVIDGSDLVRCPPPPR